MPTQLQRRRGTTLEHASFTGAQGEVTFDTNLNCDVYHSGTNARWDKTDWDTRDNLISFLQTVISKIDIGQIFKTSGVSTEGDAPARTWQIKNSTHTANGGTIVTISGNYHIEMIAWDGDVRDFGISNNSDSSTIINNADAVALTNGLPLKFVGGNTYLIDDRVLPTTSWIGDKKTTLKCKDLLDVTAPSNTFEKAAIYVGTKTDIKIEGLILDGNQSAVTSVPYLVQFHRTTRCIFKDNIVKNIWARGFSSYTVTDSTDNKCVDNHFSFVNQVRTNESEAISVAGNNWIVSGNTVIDGFDACIGIHRGDGFVVTGNILRNSSGLGPCIDVAGIVTNSEIVGNTCVATDTDYGTATGSAGCIRFNTEDSAVGNEGPCNNITVTGNTFTLSGERRAMGRMQGSGQNIIISDNVFSLESGGVLTYGFELTHTTVNSTDFKPDNIFFYNNYFVNKNASPGFNCIWFESADSKNYKLEGNHFNNYFYSIRRVPTKAILKNTFTNSTEAFGADITGDSFGYFDEILEFSIKDRPTSGIHYLKRGQSDILNYELDKDCYVWKQSSVVNEAPTGGNLNVETQVDPAGGGSFATIGMLNQFTDGTTDFYLSDTTAPVGPGLSAGDLLRVRTVISATLSNTPDVVTRVYLVYTD